MLIKLISTVFELEVTVLSATGDDNSSWNAVGWSSCGGSGKMYGRRPYGESNRQTDCVCVCEREKERYVVLFVEWLCVCDMWYCLWNGCVCV